MNCKKYYNTISKIIFIVQLPLTIKLKEDFYIQELINDGFEIEYWNVSKILYNLKLIDNIDEPYVKNIDSYKVLKKELLKLYIDVDLVVLQVTYNFQTLKLYRMVSKSKMIVAFFDRPGFTLNFRDKSNKKYFQKIININNYLIYIKYIIAKGAQKLGYVKRYNIVFSAGSESILRNTKSMYVIPINHFDYDKYLKNDMFMENLVNIKYAVFLDEYLPYHPDFEIIGSPKVPAGIYFHKMNDFFSQLEKKYNLKIIIALHPKSNYEKNPYEGRAIFRYKTPNLVKYADFVLSHASTSVSYCAIYKKPIYFISFNYFEKIYKDSLFRLMKALAKDFDTKPLNIDRELFEIKNWDKSSAYEKYVFKYLSNEESMYVHTSKIISKLLLRE